jgi:asparagine synthase (glutamine-hydrolysing)
LYLLASKINHSTKVVLQGDGGDEMFGGYRRYTTLTFFKPAQAMARLGSLVNYLAPRNTGYYRRERYLNALRPADPASAMALLLTEEDMRSDPTAVFAAEFRRRVSESDPFARYRECRRYFAGEDFVNQMLFVDAMIILPDIFLEKVDRSTMAASVEVRVPFLDNDLVDFCFRLSGPQKVRFGKKKWLLKKALEGVVPNDILYGKKTGFGVPYGYWLRDALRPLFFDQLQTFEREHAQVLDRAAVLALYDEHVSRRRDRSFLLWKILNFMIWANRFRVDFSC